MKNINNISIERLIINESIKLNKSLTETIKKQIKLPYPEYLKIKEGKRPSVKAYSCLVTYFDLNPDEIYDYPINEEERLAGK